MVGCPSVDQAYDLWILLAQARRAILHCRDRELKPYGISARQAAILFNIQNGNKQITPTELSRQLFLAPHTVSEALKRMEKVGLVKLTNDSKRRNLVRISITKKGKEAYANSRKMNSIYSIMSTLSREECVHLTSGLIKITDAALKEAGKGHKLASGLLNGLSEFILEKGPGSNGQS